MRVLVVLALCISLAASYSVNRELVNALRSLLDKRQDPGTTLSPIDGPDGPDGMGHHGPPISIADIMSMSLEELLGDACSRLAHMRKHGSSENQEPDEEQDSESTRLLQVLRRVLHSPAEIDPMSVDLPEISEKHKNMLKAMGKLCKAIKEFEEEPIDDESPPNDESPPADE